MRVSGVNVGGVGDNIMSEVGVGVGERRVSMNCMNPECWRG